MCLEVVHAARHRIQATMYSCLEPALHSFHGSFEPCFIEVPPGTRHGLLLCSSLFALCQRLPCLWEHCLGSRCWGFIPQHCRVVLLLYCSLYTTATGHGSYPCTVYCWTAHVRDHQWCSLHLLACCMDPKTSTCFGCITGIAGS